MFQPINSLQAKYTIDSEQLLMAYKDAAVRAQDFVGGMHWKSIGERQYLYKTRDRKGNAKSMGPRSEKTEEILAQFTKGKEASEERLKSLKAQLQTQSKINRAVRAGHVPNEVADICIELDNAQLLDHSITVIGTNAMHVYEAMAGVRFPGDIMATVDIDLLWNHTSKLSVASSEHVKESGLLGILKKADNSYEIMQEQRFRAVSSRGYMVDLIRQMPDPPWADEPDRFFENDMVATDIHSMKWLLSAPRVMQTVVALDGRPFRMAAPDPRAFTMFKLWLSRADDREPTKQRRDAEQAAAMIHLIEEHLPHLARAWPSLKSFPENIRDEAMRRSEVARQRG